MMWFKSELAAASLLVSLTSASAKGILPNTIKNLVTFGDSYTDVVNVFDGGAPWPIYLADYANLTLFAFAQAGAVCNQNLTPRSDFPAVVQDQIPEYFDALAAGNITGDANNTLFTQWIGTNDVGQLLTGAQAGDATVVETVACAVEWVKTMYDGGARNFLFQNVSTRLLMQDTYLLILVTGSRWYHWSEPFCTPTTRIPIAIGRRSATRRNGASSCAS